MIDTELLLELQQVFKGCFLRPESMILCEGESFLRRVLSIKSAAGTILHH